MVCVGGLGRFEGALLGAITLFAVEMVCQWTGVWYLVGFGCYGYCCALYFLPKGLLGAIENRLGITLCRWGYQTGFGCRHKILKGVGILCYSENIRCDGACQLVWGKVPAELVCATWGLDCFGIDVVQTNHSVGTFLQGLDIST